MLEQRINEIFGDKDPSGFGTGWWSGVLSAFFGLLSFGAVVCLHFPQLLSSPELRAYYPMPLMRLLIQAVIVGAILCGVASAMLRRKKVLALTGILFALLASLLGGASVPINQDLHNGPAIGLDWFLLDILMMTLIFSPIEVLWPAYRRAKRVSKRMADGHRVFPLHASADSDHHLPDPSAGHAAQFRLEHPGSSRTRWAICPGSCNSFWRSWLPIFAEYFIHRAFHKVPFMWRFHAIHHSSKSLDWIAGSRSHIVDDVAVRGVHPDSHDVRVFSQHARGLSVFREHSRHLGALQFRPDDQVAGAVPGPAEIPSLASHLAARGHRQELRHPLSVDRQDIRNPLPARGQVAGQLRFAQREHSGRFLGPDFLSADPQQAA